MDIILPNVRHLSIIEINILHHHLDYHEKTIIHIMSNIIHLIRHNTMMIIVIHVQKVMDLIRLLTIDVLQDVVAAGLSSDAPACKRRLCSGLRLVHLFVTSDEVFKR